MDELHPSDGLHPRIEPGFTYRDVDVSFTMVGVSGIWLTAARGKHGKRFQFSQIHFEPTHDDPKPQFDQLDEPRR